MKENAPEKIYIDNPNHEFWYRTKGENSIEYTRTDAFIEKACSILKDISCQIEIIEQFKKRIR